MGNHPCYYTLACLELFPIYISKSLRVWSKGNGYSACVFSRIDVQVNIKGASLHKSKLEPKPNWNLYHRGGQKVEWFGIALESHRG